MNSGNLRDGTLTDAFRGKNQFFLTASERRGVLALRRLAERKKNKIGLLFVALIVEIGHSIG